MPINPVKIPQNVYVEDRVVGPLTLKQTIIMVVGGGISYTIFALLQKSAPGGKPDLILSIIAWIPCAVSVLFALVKINDLSLLRICLLLIERFNKAPVRTWAPRTGITLNIRFSTPVKDDSKAQQALLEQQRNEKRIHELSSIVDRPIGGFDGEPSDDFSVEKAIPTPDLPGEPGTTLDGITPEAPAKPQPLPPSQHKPTTGPTFSDLSVFKDIFSPDQKWQ